MKISEYVALLLQHQTELGDVEVFERMPYAPMYSVREITKPLVRELKVKTSRESYTKVMGDSPDPKDISTGVKVVVV